MALLKYTIEMRPSEPTLRFNLSLVKTDKGDDALELTGVGTNLTVDFTLRDTPASVFGAILTLGVSQVKLTSLGHELAEDANEKIMDAIKEIKPKHEISNLLKQNFDVAGCSVSAEFSDVSLGGWNSFLMFDGKLTLT